MATTVIKRPSYYRFSETPLTTYTIAEEGFGGGGAVITPKTGFTDGDVVYLRNTLTSYTGVFTLQDNADPAGYYLVKDGFLAPYIQDAEVSIYTSEGGIDWSCVHLPIEYVLRTTNTNPTRSVTGFSNNNGLVRITLSGSLDVQELDWLKLNGDPSGNFQILIKHSSSDYTINMPYALVFGVPYAFNSTTARRHLHNLVVTVNVYAGLPAAHIWEDEKGYSLVTELRYAISDLGFGDTSFSISEIIKEQLAIQENRPNYNSQPYDLDRFAAFYIEFAEEYDSSDGITVSRYNTGYITDGFTGYAADSKLVFKNRYAGYLSNYVYTDSSHLAKFLTDSTEDLKFYPGLYLDTSIIVIPGANSTSLTIQATFLSGDGATLGVDQTFVTLTPESAGIIRAEVPQTFPSNTTEIRMRIYLTDTIGEEDPIIVNRLISEDLLVDVQTGCVMDGAIYLTWKNHLGGFNYWLFNSNKDHNVAILDTKQSDRNYFTTWPESYGENADTLRQETYRSSVNELTIRAENLSDADIDFLSGIKVSSLVQIMTSKYDRRTVLVDSSSFKKRTDNDKISSLEMTIRYTDNLPSQSL